MYKLYAAAVGLVIALAAYNVTDAVEASTLKINSHHAELAMLMEE